jgi:hypothetical protein
MALINQTYKPSLNRCADNHIIVAFCQASLHTNVSLSKGYSFAGSE